MTEIKDSVISSTDRTYHEQREQNPLSREILEQIIQEVRDGVLIITQDMNIIFANASILQQLQLSREDVIGKKCFDVAHLQSIPYESFQHSCPIVEGDSEKSRSKPIIYSHMDGDGKMRFLELTVKQISGPNGEIQYLYISRDITEQMKSERQLQEDERQISELVSSMRDILFEFDEHGTYLQIWTGNENILMEYKENRIGKTIAQIMGEKMSEILLPIIQRVLDTDRAETVEYALQVKDGERFFEAIITPVKTAHNKPRTVSMLTRDITEFKKMEAKIRHAQRIEDIGDFTSAVAHQLNSILMLPLVYSQTCSEQLEGIHPCLSATQKAVKLTRQALDYAGKQMIHLRTIPLDEYLEKTLENKQALNTTDTKDIHIQLQRDARSGKVRLDPEKFKVHLMDDLLLYFREYIKTKGQITLQTRLVSVEVDHHSESSLLSAGDYIELEIQCTGIEIAPKKETQFLTPELATGVLTGFEIPALCGYARQTGGDMFIERDKETKTIKIRILLPRVSDE